jgi:hypothetical protein
MLNALLATSPIGLIARATPASPAGASPTKCTRATARTLARMSPFFFSSSSVWPMTFRSIASTRLLHHSDRQSQDLGGVEARAVPLAEHLVHPRRVDLVLQVGHVGPVAVMTSLRFGTVTSSASMGKPCQMRVPGSRPIFRSDVL